MQLFTGIEYIKIDVANKYGLDKENWDVRIDWFNQNEYRLRELVDEADEPAQFYAAVTSYEKALRGIPSGTPISLDATASGSQILCALTGDIEGGKLCNIIDTGERKDLYTEIYKYMVEKYNLPSGISQKLVKKAIMTSMYSSIAQPKRVFGAEHIDDFYITMSTKMRGAWILNAILLDFWRSDVDHYMWTLPDNFHAGFKVMVESSEDFVVNGKEYTSTYMEQGHADSGRALPANITHSIDAFMVREITARAMYSPKQVAIIKRLLRFLPVHNEIIREESTEVVTALMGQFEKTGILSARILDHINSTNINMVDEEALKNLLKTLPRKPFEVLCVHD